MFKTKELAHIIIAIIIFAFVISFLQGINAFLWALLIALIIIAVNILTKKLTAYKVSAKIESKILQWQRWGWYERSHLKKPLPMGIILPFALIFLSWGYIKCLILLQTDIKTTTARAAKRTGFPKRFIEMTEWHTALIPGIGITANLVLALLIFLFVRNYPLAVDIAKLSVYYALWNLVPLGKLDGTKIFFGSKILWIVLTIPALILLILGLVLF